MRTLSLAHVLALLAIGGCGTTIVTTTGSSTSGGGSASSASSASSGCVVEICANMGIQCGEVSNGCGSMVTCGGCPEGETCVDSQCKCTPASCAQLGISCGQAGDGCGGVLDCGGCAPPQTCGGASCGAMGTPGVCGGGDCCPATCAQLGYNCGAAADGCGNLIQCGSCPQGQTCDAFMPNVCSATCDLPKTCAQQGFNCGPASDDCGGTLQCGVCPMGQTCGGPTCGLAGTPNVCGGGGGCCPKTCAQLGLECGAAGDGCGNVIQCGSCPGGSVCGGGPCGAGTGMPGMCGSGGCCPKTCPEVGANCGVVGDGCGSILQCGACPAGQSCGGGSQPKANVCG